MGGQKVWTFTRLQDDENENRKTRERRFHPTEMLKRKTVVGATLGDGYYKK